MILRFGYWSRRAWAPSALSAGLVLALAAGIASARFAAPSRPTTFTPEQETQAVVAAADAYLGTLSRGQRGVTQRPFEPQREDGTLVSFARAGRGETVTPSGRPRAAGDAATAGFPGEKYGQAVWSNYPIGGVPRAGLQTGFMSVAQRAAALHLLQAALSPMGYRKVLDIMAADRAFAADGLPYAAGPDAFTLGIFGQPSTTAPWMITYTGHHLGLNIVIAGPRATIAPTLTGAEPTRFRLGDRTVRVLADENDKAFALLDALRPDQRRQAVLGFELADLVYGPGHGGTVFAPEGLKGSALDPRQKAMLLDLVDEWAGMIHPAYAAPHLAEIRAGLDNTYFSWRGPTTRASGQNGAAYFRVQGPKLIVEFAPQTTDGDPRLHVHTIYRDPTDDYGRSFTL